MCKYGFVLSSYQVDYQDGWFECFISGCLARPSVGAAAATATRKSTWEVGSDRGIAGGYRGVLASFALQVEHRNLNVKLRPIWSVWPLSACRKRPSTRLSASQRTISHALDILLLAVKAPWEACLFGIAVFCQDTKTSLVRRFGHFPEIKSPEGRSGRTCDPHLVSA